MVSDDIDLPQICDVVEDIMQLGVDDKFKKGILNFEEADVDDFLERYKEGILETYPKEDKDKLEELFDFFDGLSMDEIPNLLKGDTKLKHWPRKWELLKELARMFVISQSVMGYYAPEEDNFYVINENIKMVTGMIGFAKDLQISEEDLLEMTVVHELAHKTHGDHYPKLFEKFREKGRLVASLESKMNTGTYKSYSFTTKAKVQLDLRKRKDSMFGTRAYIEGVGQYVQEEFGKRKGEDVMKAIEESKGFMENQLENMIMRVLDLKDITDSYKKGCNFLRHVEEETGENPLVFTYDRPPKSRREIEKPWKYIKRV